MTLAIGVLTLAAILTGIAVTILLAIAALVEIVPPLFARDSESADSSATRAVRPPSEDRPAARSGMRITR